MKLQKLELTKKYLERIDKQVISKNDDRVLVVLGDEGVGKSTYMLQLAQLWRSIRNGDSGSDSVLESMVWGKRSDFTDALRERPEGSIICVQDAPHVLFRREAMHGEQIDVEKNLLDIRIKNFLIVLGFQDWADVPTSLTRRRAENVFLIPRRGVVRGYSRSGIDERRDSESWPDPEFQDRFPDLEGTELWTRFQERDREAKMDRLDDLDEPNTEDVERREQIKTALRAVKPWSNDGLTYREAAKICDYSAGWISDRVQEWKDGEHKDIVEHEEKSNSETASA